MPEESMHRPLSDVASIETGYAFKSADFSRFGFPVIRMSDLNNGAVDLEEAARVRKESVTELERFLLKKGDFLFGLSGSLDAYGVYYSDEIAYLNQRVGRLADVDKNSADYRYLVHQLSSKPYYLYAYKEALGIAQLNISTRQVGQFSAFLPEVKEQKKISQILDTLDHQIRQTEALVAKLKKIKQGLLTDLLTRGIDENGQLRPKPGDAPALYKDSPLGLMPNEWTFVKIQDLSPRTILGTVKRGQKDSGQLLKLLKMGNLSWGNQLNLDGVEVISRDVVPDTLNVEDGDVLFNTRNTPELVGKTCAWRGNGEGYTFDNNILRLRFPVETLSGHFVATYMGSHLGRKRLLSISTGTTSVAAIYWRALEQYWLPVPPLSEQQEIMSRLYACDSEIHLLAQELKKLKQQKNGFMDDLLTGRVRVTPLLKEPTEVAAE